VPAATFEEALEVLAGFLRTQKMELADVLACDRFDLDDWDYEIYPLDSPTWLHIYNVVEFNCIWTSDVTPVPPSSDPMPAPHPRFFIVEATILKDVVPGARGKTAYRWYGVPPKTLNEALVELRRCVVEDDMRMEDILKMFLLDEPPASRDRKLIKAIRRVVARGEVWRGPVFFGP
jgi:hypothetical protein